MTLVEISDFGSSLYFSYTTKTAFCTRRHTISYTLEIKGYAQHHWVTMYSYGGINMHTYAKVTAGHITFLLLSVTQYTMLSDYTILVFIVNSRGQHNYSLCNHIFTSDDGYCESHSIRSHYHIQYLL